MTGPVGSGRAALYLGVALRRVETDGYGAVVTSAEIADEAGITNATQVRRDLMVLTSRRVGRRGVGYVASSLAAALRDVLAGRDDETRRLADDLLRRSTLLRRAADSIRGG